MAVTLFEEIFMKISRLKAFLILLDTSPPQRSDIACLITGELKLFS